MDEDSSLKVINSSGYPLQIAIHHAINKRTASHGWRVHASEHHWSSSNGARTGFADLVAGDRGSRVFAVIECKRVQDTEWLVFHSDGQQCNRRHAQAWVSQPHQPGAAKIHGWSAVQIEPACPEIHFCALRGQKTGEGSTLLERTAAEVALATERIACEHASIRGAGTACFFPVIATTAKLRVATFNPGAISLVDGKLSTVSFEDAPYVRLRKQLGVLQAADHAEGALVGYDNESTVFIVQAQAVNDFLSLVELEGSTLR